MGKKCRLIKKCESDNAVKININIPIVANRSKLDLLLFFFIKKNNNKNIHDGKVKGGNNKLKKEGSIICEKNADKVI